MSESAGRAPPLARTLAGGEVLWLGDLGSSWLLTGAPEWWSLRQGAGGLFDRDLALEWRRRFGVLTAARLVRQDVDFAAVGGLEGQPVVGRSSLRQVCASPGGPAWIVAPVERLEPAAVAEAASVWRPSARDIVPAPSDGRMTQVSAYALFSCSRLASAVTPAASAR